MSEVSAVQIPLCNLSYPALWLIMCESTFALATPKPIAEFVTKYNYIVANLPPNTASLVRDILMHPDATDPYAQIKNELINRPGESFQQEARKLFSGEELGSRKPSELLRNMKRRAEFLNIDDKLIMELFLQRLPSSVQTILAAVSDLTLNKAADIADLLNSNIALFSYLTLRTEFSKSHHLLLKLLLFLIKRSKHQNLNCFVK
ncbi:retrovirus-related Pol polyprotein from transposon gypsy [Trichonephila clavipes]|nr:retrovirus-related Pol polyprotein from transposon gypsy [Trichonephila clavipes]